MKKKRNFLLKSILLQLNFSLEKAGILLVLVLVFSIQAKAYSQTRITAKRQGVTIDEVLKEVREKSGYRFLYRVEEVNRYGKRDIDVKDAEVEDFLGQLLQNTDLTYEVENEVIIIRPEKQRQDSRVNVQVVRGKVTDENNLALPGATVLLKGTSYGVVTDSHGKFTMEVLERDTVTLLVSFVGMETRLVNLKKGQTEVLVSLEPDIKEMKEVVVTGYGNVRKTSFTGNSVTVTKDELMSVSKSNVIKALQAFDPSFRILNIIQRIFPSLQTSALNIVIPDVRQIFRSYIKRKKSIFKQQRDSPIDTFDCKKSQFRSVNNTLHFKIAVHRTHFVYGVHFPRFINHCHKQIRLIFIKMPFYDILLDF